MPSNREDIRLPRNLHGSTAAEGPSFVVHSLRIDGIRLKNVRVQRGLVQRLNTRVIERASALPCRVAETSKLTRTMPFPSPMRGRTPSPRWSLFTIAGWAQHSDWTVSPQPLDTIKVRMQARPDAFSGMFQCLRRTLAEESIVSLWKGSTPALSGAVAENMVAFGVNEQLKRLFPARDGKQAPWWQPIFFGGVTGIFTSVVVCPSDVIKCKVQIGRSIRQGVVETGGIGGTGAALPVLNATQMARHVLRTQGIRGLFVGLGVQFARDIPFFAAFFGTYETVVNQGKESWHEVPLEALYFMAGGLAGVVGWAVVMPIDMVKSIIQTADKPQSMIRTAQMVHQTQGWRALFAGLSAALVRAFPANAALFLGYEVVRRAL